MSLISQVAVVATRDSYGESAFNLFKLEALANGVAIAVLASHNTVVASDYNPRDIVLPLRTLKVRTEPDRLHAQRPNQCRT